jgi:aldose 1-epimerase
MPQAIQRFTLKNKNNMQVTVADYGARILSIKTQDKNGKLVETTVNYQTDQEIFDDQSYMGTTVGRVCNRISNACFELNGKTFKLPANEGKNTLHGGTTGFDKLFWKTQGLNETGDKISFEIVSPDGDQGFPGELTLSVNYELNNANELSFRYVATSTKDTPINICNHAYFSLGETHVNDMQIQLKADSYLPVDNDSIPLGHFEPVSNTRFDLNQLTDLHTVLGTDGYDHCYKITDRNAVKVIAKNTGITLEVETDYPGIQLYTGNFLPVKQSALCLEAQGFPDAINQTALPADILKAGEVFQRYVIYRYGLC